LPRQRNTTAALPLEQQRKVPRLNGPLLRNPISAFSPDHFKKGGLNLAWTQADRMEAAVLCAVSAARSVWVVYLRAGKKFVACFSQLGADFAGQFTSLIDW
jgi:hypothetical protein